MKPIVYLPQSGTMPAQVVTFFAANPDEELTSLDISEKFACSRTGVHSNLAMCVDAGLLKRITNADSDPAYIATAFTAQAARRIASLNPASTVKEQPAQGINKMTRKQPIQIPEIDFDKLKVDDGVKIPTTGTLKGHDKWGPVFDKLKKSGQSIELPIEARGAVGAAMSKRNRALGKRTFCIRVMSEKTCRVWRVEA